MNNFKDVIKDLQETECLSDVTLVCNDETKIKAHKFVLIGSSPVMRSMLLQSSQRDTIVYLRGVDKSELDWLLQFMYLGQTQVPQTKLQSFLELAKELKMKGIHDEDNGKTAETEANKVFEAVVPINNYKMTCEERNMVGVSQNLQEEKRENIVIPDLENGQQPSKQEVVRFPCEYCNHQSESESTLNIHIQKEHEGVRYPCDHCTHQAKSKRNLIDHKATKHKVDPIFRCMLCDYCTNHTTVWKIHARRKHPKFEEHEIFTETRYSDRKFFSKHRVGLISNSPDLKMF